MSGEEKEEGEEEGMDRKKASCLKQQYMTGEPAYRHENRYKDSRLRERRAGRTVVVELRCAKLGHLRNNR